MRFFTVSIDRTVNLFQGLSKDACIGIAADASGYR